MYDLFNPHPPYQPHSDPSRDAAESVRGKTATMRLRVLEAIRAAGPRGATDDEIQHALDMNPSTQRPRRVELVRLGMVRDSGLTRATKSGRKATIWVEVSCIR